MREIAFTVMMALLLCQGAFAKTPDGGMNGSVAALACDGASNLSAGANLTTAGGVLAQGNGDGWSPLKNGGAKEKNKRIIEDGSLTPRGCANPVKPEFASATWDGGIRVYDTAGQLTRELSQPDEYVYSLAYSSDGASLLAGTDSGNLLVWDLGSGECEVVAHVLDNVIGIVGWLGNDKLVWGGARGDTGVMGVVNRQDGTTAWERQGVLLIYSGRGFSASPDGKKIAVLSEAGSGTYILDGQTGEMLTALILPDTEGDFEGAVCFGVDNNTVAVGMLSMELGGRKNKVYVWNSVEHNITRALKGKANTYAATLAFSPDGRFLACGFDVDAAKVWSLKNGKLVKTINVAPYVDPLVSVGFSSDGQYVFTLASGKLIIVKAPK